MKRRVFASIVGLFVALPFVSFAQAPATAPPKPDSPAVEAMVETAKKTPGPMCADEVHFFCEAPRANAATDPAITPAKIFDKVYAVGNSGTGVYVVHTSASLL